MLPHWHVTIPIKSTAGEQVLSVSAADEPQAVALVQNGGGSLQAQRLGTVLRDWQRLTVKLAQPQLEADSPVVAAFNAAFQRDPAALAALVSNQVPCRSVMALQPGIGLVPSAAHAEEATTALTALSLVNLALGAYGLRRIQPVWVNAADGTRQLTGFTELQAPGFGE